MFLGLRGRTRTRWLFTLAALCGSIAGVFWAVGRYRDPSPAVSDPQPPTRSSREFRVDDFAYQLETPGRTRIAVSAREVLVRKRRFGPFSINPLRELVASDVLLNFDRSRRAVAAKGGDQEPDRSNPQGAYPMGLGAVSRATVTGIAIEITRGETVDFRIESRRARARLRDGSLDLLGGISVKARDGDVITGRSGRLFDGAKLLRLDHDYTWQSSGPTKRGSNAVVSLEDDGHFHIESSVRRAASE